MSGISLHEAARSACKEIGIEFRDVPANDEWHPTPIANDASSKTDGRIKLFGDRQGGIAYNWKTGEQRSFFAAQASNADYYEIEPAKNDAPNKAEKAAKLACQIWVYANPVERDHPYLKRKQVTASSALRELSVNALSELLGYQPQSSGNRLSGRILVGLIMVGDEVSSAEFIDEFGRKCALKGGAKSGGAWLPEALPDQIKKDTPIVIGEGIATVLSLVEALPCIGVAALSCSNLEKVARSLRQRYPESLIVIAGDRGNGEQKAREAAAEVSGVLALPDFTEDATGSDFNDLLVSAGCEQVSQQVNAAISLGGRSHAVGIDWPTPQPIEPVLPAVPKFDPDKLLPEGIKAWVMDEAERMPCSPEYVAVGALTALGAVIGTSCCIRPKSLDSWSVVPNLWGVMIGEPSAMKTPAMNAALRLLEKLANRALEDWKAKKADYANGPDPSRETEPKLRRFLTDDPTMEKLGEILSDNPQGILVKRDELMGLVDTWHRQGREGERSFYLTAWSGTESYAFDRISRGTVLIPRLCASLFGGTQPDKLQMILSSARDNAANDGLLQRFQLMVYPDPIEWEWVNREPDVKAANIAEGIFQMLADSGSGGPGTNQSVLDYQLPYFTFDDQAQDVFLSFMRRLKTRRILDDEGVLQQHLEKYQKLFPALALIFHLVSAVQRGIDGNEKVAKAAAVMAKDWCEFLEAHARRCYSLGMNSAFVGVNALADRLRAGSLSTPFTAYELRRKNWKHLNTDHLARAAIDGLTDAGWLCGIAKGGKGRASGKPTVRYYLNPDVTFMKLI